MDLALVPGLVLLVIASSIARAPQDGDAAGEPGPFCPPPDLALLVSPSGGLRDLVERFETDHRTLRRFFDASFSTARRAEEMRMMELWLGALDAIDFDALDADARIDYVLLRNRLRYELRRLEIDAAERDETLALVPFGDAIVELQEARRRLEPGDPARAAELLVELAESIEPLKERLRRGLGDEEERASDGLVVEPTVANRAASEVRELRRVLESWFSYHDGYDPVFSWWLRAPYGALSEALDGYASFLREEIVGVDEDDADTIIGDPIGRDALLVELENAMIPYTPEELMAIAEREFAWCERERLRASNDLGFGDDWRAALEHVKGLHVGPGEQPELIRQLAFEAVDFLEANELLTIPELAKRSWRMEMMSPERQKYTPYFTGGEVISVSFPTDGMDHADKRMSMRGNNVHFSRATVHHELIPGHHLQQFMNARHRSYRRAFWTPFWTEGWALYWEMLLWDEGFPGSPEDRMGMLFWRSHRCARILFSLGFHLGELTPAECIELLTERVGHELKNATAEVRRSVQGGYGPLYQCAYMVGGLQFRSLHAELVGGGRLSNRAFHDAVLREGPIPVEMVRAKLTGEELTRERASRWRF